MEFAELEILKSVQKFNFQVELESLNKSESKGHVKKSSSLRSLNPILMNDLLHIGGRLSLASTHLEPSIRLFCQKTTTWPAS